MDNIQILDDRRPGRFYSTPKLRKIKPIYVLVQTCHETGVPLRISTAPHTKASRESLQRLADCMQDAWVQTEWEECK